MWALCMFQIGPRIGIGIQLELKRKETGTKTDAI